MKNSANKETKDDGYYVQLSRALNKLAGTNSHKTNETMNLRISENNLVCPCCEGRFPNISKIKEVPK
jgi:hypothetical protein